MSARNMLTRRNALVAGGIAAMTAAVAACSDDPEYEEAESRPDDVAETNLRFAALAAGLEVAAAGAYGKALDAANSGALGAVPVAVAEFVSTAKAHHEEYRTLWNKRLTAAERPEVTEPNPTLQGMIDEQFRGVTDVPGAANLALALEQILSHTYAKAIPTLYNLDITPATPGLGGVVQERERDDPVRTAGQCQIVDQQRQAILLYVLGQYPVPESFQAVDKAITA